MRTVIVEDASRFARELMAQELGITLLISRGVRLVTAAGDDLTASDDPSRKMMRQIAGAFAEYEKARLVGQAQERPRSQAPGRRASARAGEPGSSDCAWERKGPKADAVPPDPAAAVKIEEAIAIAKRLRRASPKTGERRSLRKISAELAALGYLNERGAPYSAKSVRAMLAQ